MRKSTMNPQPEKSSANSNRRRGSTLAIHNIIVLGRRTTIRLEPEMWQALHEIAQRERCNVNDLCSLVHRNRMPGRSLTAAIRVFAMLYFKEACTEDGHKNAGHGDLRRLKFDFVQVNIAVQAGPHGDKS